MTLRDGLPRIIFVFLAVDWPLFSRRPMVEALADAVRKRGSTVVAINRPLCPLSTLSRKPGRFRELFSTPRVEQLSPNLYLYSPKYLLHDSQAPRFPPVESLNIFALRRSLKSLLHRLQLPESPPLVWYYSPQQAYVMQTFEQSINIYEIYDSLGDIHGRANKFLDILEEKYRRDVDVLLTTSRVLHDLYSPHYRNSLQFGNGLRRSHLENLSASVITEHPILRNLGHPRLGYCGALSGRLNWSLIMEIARARTQWQLIFVGPKNGFVPDEQLAVHPNIHVFGAVPHVELAALYRSLDIGIMPYLDNDFFRALNPLKFYEFAAAGIPCVSSPIPELKPFDRRCVRVCHNELRVWVDAITDQLKNRGEEASHIGFEIASKFLWEDMVERVLDHIESTVPTKAS